MNKLLVSMAERRWIREEASIEMGKMVKNRVIDLDKMVARIREQREKLRLSPYIDIIPIHPDSHKSPNKMPTFQKDPVTGVYYGIANGEDDFGNIRWQRLQLSDSISLNLDKEMECRMWAVLRFNPDIEGSPFQKQQPYYKIFDPVDQANVEMQEVVQMKRAFEMVDSLRKAPKDMVFFARYLGEDLRDNANRSIVEGAVLRYARHSPMEFIQKFESRARSYAERFYTALHLGIIEQHPDRGYQYKNLPLGYSEEEAIKMLSTDNSLMTGINSLILEKDTVMRIVTAEHMAEASRLLGKTDESDLDKELKEIEKEKEKVKEIIVQNVKPPKKEKAPVGEISDFD